jgi:hypothetical protein
MTSSVTTLVDWKSALKSGIAAGKQRENATEWAIVVLRCRSVEYTAQKTVSWSVVDIYEGKMQKAAQAKCVARLNSPIESMVNPAEVYGACALCCVLCCMIPNCCCTGKFYVKGCVLVNDGEHIYAIGASGSRNCMMDQLVRDKCP